MTYGNIAKAFPKVLKNLCKKGDLELQHPQLRSICSCSHLASVIERSFCEQRVVKHRHLHSEAKHVIYKYLVCFSGRKKLLLSSIVNKLYSWNHIPSCLQESLVELSGKMTWLRKQGTNTMEMKPGFNQWECSECQLGQPTLNASPGLLSQVCGIKGRRCGLEEKRPQQGK